LSKGGNSKQIRLFSTLAKGGWGGFRERLFSGNFLISGLFLQIKSEYCININIFIAKIEMTLSVQTLIINPWKQDRNIVNQ
jgi:hypothetical protein